MNKVFALFICLIISGCGSVMMVDKIPFKYTHNYDLKAVIDSHEISNIGILPFNGPGGHVIQDGLKKMLLQANKFRVFDSVELLQMIQEKQLKADELYDHNVKDILNIDMFITGDVVLSDGVYVITQIRLLDGMGWVRFSYTIVSKDIPSAVEGAQIIVNDTQVPVSVERKLFLDSNDPDKQAIINLVGSQKIQELSQLLQNKVLAVNVGKFKDTSYYHYDLAVIYESLNEFGKAWSELGEGIQKTIWYLNNKAFMSYDKYLRDKVIQHPQMTNIYYYNFQENAPKIAVLDYQSPDKDVKAISSNITSGIVALQRYNICRQSEFLRLFKKEDIPTKILEQTSMADYIIKYTLKNTPETTLEKSPNGTNVEKVSYRIQFTVIETKTGNTVFNEEALGQFLMYEGLTKERLFYESRLKAVNMFIQKLSSIL